MRVPASALLEALPFYALVLDDQHYILQANRAVRDQLGLEPDAIIGQYCPTVVHGLEEPFYACPLEEAVEKGCAVEREAFDEKTGRWLRVAIYPVAPSGPDERTLYFHMVFDITAAKRAEEELKASHDQLRELSRFLESVREDERTKLAREIHDELGQTLTGIKMDLSWLAGRFPQDHELLVRRTESLYKLVEETIQSVKRICSELRPAVLDDLGLAPALQWLTCDFGKRAGLRCRFSAHPHDIVLDRDRSTAIFRICQEALTNVVRHAEATRVSVRLTKGPHSVILRISDNGKGIRESQIVNPRAFGLLGMRERAREWSGELRVSGTPGKGTVVTLGIPLGRAKGPSC
ncbi:MAG: histidine kinase [Actinobacteria bacterium]|nr:histidine kinase [Actinomycetota bacterium]